MVRYSGFCFTRSARGAGGITPFRAAHDRDRTQRVVPLAETVKIVASEHRGLSSGKRLHEGDTAWDKGIWLGKSETIPEHTVGTQNGVMGTRTIRRLEQTQRSETSLLLEIQGVPWDLVLNAPRRGTQETPDTCTSLTTSSRKPGQVTVLRSSSSSTQAPSGLPQHAWKSADSTVELLGACSTCQCTAVTRKSRRTLAQRR